MRRNVVYRAEFNPYYAQPSTMAILDGAYEKNKPINKEFAERSVDDFIKNKSHLHNEQEVLTRSDLVRIYGSPTGPASSFRSRQRSYDKGKKGNNLDLAQFAPAPISDKDRETSRIQDVFHEEYIKLHSRTQGNPNIFENKKRMIIQQLDEGYQLAIPKNQRWHESNRGVNTARLDTASVQMLQISLAKLRRPAGEADLFAPAEKPAIRMSTFARQRKMVRKFDKFYSRLQQSLESRTRGLELTTVRRNTQESSADSSTFKTSSRHANCSPR